MKRFVALFVAVLALSSFTAAEKEFSIVGRWETLEDGETFTLTFDKDGYAIIQKGNESMGGKEFVMNGEKGSMTYVVDYAKEPDNLDIVVTKLSTKEKRTMIKCIFKVLNDNEILMVADTDKRPTSLESDLALVFKRK